MIPQERTLAFLLGSYVADSAALGLHWIYDLEEIDRLTENGQISPAFLRPAPDHYHSMKNVGDLTQYGEGLRVLHKSLLRTGGIVDIPDYQKEFAAHFDSGGKYQGYIDKPTRITLENLRKNTTSPSGADDDQNPATSKLPVLIAAYAARNTDIFSVVERAVEVTNNNVIAQHYARIVAASLLEGLRSGNLTNALKAGFEYAEGKAETLISEALHSKSTDSIKMAGHFGRACRLHQSIPTAFHILKNSNSFVKAVETNILAGGDSSGRATFIGALLGACYGFGTEKGLPVSWIAKLNNFQNISRDCEALLKNA